uniref:Family with sequence similarity 131 member Ba n=1 Tax=Neolamprologus brichardi TaxID=32507 RepID=A0A3Q4G5C2_NEOBR
NNYSFENCSTFSCLSLSMEDTTSILPRLKRKSANTYGIGALAKSSLSGVSGVFNMCMWYQSRNWDLLHVHDVLASLGSFHSCYMHRLSPSSGIMQQFAISEATLFGWNSMDGESMGAGSNQGSVAHLSEVNQESITSRDQVLHHSSADVWPHTYVSQGLYCLSSSDAWDPITSQPEGVASPAAGSYIMAAAGGTPGEGYEGTVGSYIQQHQVQLALQQQSQLQQLQQLHHYQQQQFLQYQQQQQSMEHRLHSASHSLQATPNSTIHSLGPPTHPRLADLWGAAQVEIVGHLNAQMADMVGGVVETVGEEPEPESEDFPEQREEEELTKVEEVTLTLEPEPCSLTPSPLREDASSTRGSSPGLPAQTSEPVAERIPFDVTPCVVQSLEEKDEEADEGSIVVVATN